MDSEAAPTTQTITTVSSSCLQGRRVRNEDATIELEITTISGARVRLMIVADGVGGRSNGHLASHLVCRQFAVGFMECLLCDELDLATIDGRVSAAMDSAAHAAHHELRARAGARPAADGMATTLVTAVIAFDRLYVGWVGDSACYLMRAGISHPITRDHSLVNEWVMEGLVAAEDAGSHPRRNVISRCIDSRAETVDLDVRVCRLQTSDLVWLCSDGLLGGLDETQISAALSAANPLGTVADALAQDSIAGGSRDNVSVICCRCDQISDLGIGHQTLTESYATELGGFIKT